MNDKNAVKQKSKRIAQKVKRKLQKMQTINKI